MESVLSYIITLIIGLLGGGIIGKIYLAKLKENADVKLKLFDNRIDEIVKFTKSTGLSKLIDFFNTVNPSDLQSDLKNVPQLGRLFL
jgi:hypothetical protein